MPIEIKEVTYIYQSATPVAIKALDSISLDLAEGQIYGIMGQSGSGKSTILQVMNGLLLPQKGIVKVDGQVLSELKPRQMAEIRRRVGLVFQFPEFQFFETTAAQEVAFGLRNFNYKNEEIEPRVQSAMELTGLSYGKYKDRRPETLSSGEKRRLALASIIAFEPSYLLLDEPAAGLDYNGRQSLLRALRFLNQARNTTIIIVSHKLSHLVPLCNQIVFMEKGRIKLTASRNELINLQDELREMNIEPPIYQQVVMELNKRGWQLGGNYTGMEEAARDIAIRLNGQ